MPDREKVIKELDCLPTTVYDGFYQLRITHDLRDKVVKLLKEQNGLMLALEQSNAVNGYLNAEVERLNGLLKEQDAEIRQLRLALDIAKGTCKGIVMEGR